MSNLLSGARSDHGKALKAFRLERSRSEAGLAALFNGLAVAGLSLANQLLGAVSTLVFVLHIIVAALLLGVAWVFSRRVVPAHWVPWVAGACALLVTGEFELEVWNKPDALGLSYVLLIMLAAGPMILDPMVFGVVSTVSLAGCIVITQHALSTLTPQSLWDWALVGLAAEVIGGMLMGMRLRAIDELGRSTQMVKALATHDALTGVYNRHGMADAMRAIVTESRDAGRGYHATFVDIDWLKTANDNHGHDFGDQVIRTVAKTVRACVEPECAIARWGGDEFLVFGPDDAPDDDTLEATLGDALRAEIDPLMWPGTVSVGSASSSVAGADVERLTDIADERMYMRRRAKRQSA